MHTANAYSECMQRRNLLLAFFVPATRPLDLDSCRCRLQPPATLPRVLLVILTWISTLRQHSGPKILLLAKWVVAIPSQSMNPLPGHPRRERRSKRRSPRETHEERHPPSQSMNPLPRHPPRERRSKRRSPRERHRERRPPSENVPATLSSCCSRLQASSQRLPIC